MTSMKKVVLHTLVIRSYVFAVGSTIHQHLSHTLMILESLPIIIYMSDGASDEAARFPKPLQIGVALFKELKLHVLLNGVNAAGLSTSNPVERRMAPLSHDLAGIILQHESYNNDLDESGKTVDLELEKQNFFKAAEGLSEIWSRTVILLTAKPSHNARSLYHQHLMQSGLLIMSGKQGIPCKL